jgi:hypothetical protein
MMTRIPVPAIAKNIVENGMTVSPEYNVGNALLYITVNYGSVYCKETAMLYKVE